MLQNDFCSGLCTQNIIGSGSVQVHRFEILKVRVRFRFNDLKFKRFRFGSGSPKKSGFYRFAVQVRFDFLVPRDSSDDSYTDSKYNRHCDVTIYILYEQPSCANVEVRKQVCRISQKNDRS